MCRDHHWHQLVPLELGYAAFLCWSDSCGTARIPRLSSTKCTFLERPDTRVHCSVLCGGGPGAALKEYRGYLLELILVKARLSAAMVEASRDLGVTESGKSSKNRGCGRRW